MKSEKTLAVVGCTDEATAHLRLLMRKGAHRLVHRWQFVGDDEAQFVVVDPDDIYGAVARVRASARHMPYAIYCDDEHIGKDELVLRRPLKLENVVDVLNAASRVLDGESAGKPDDLLQYFGTLYRFQPDAPEEPKRESAPVEIVELAQLREDADPWGHDEDVVQPREPVAASVPDEAEDRVESLRAKSRPAMQHHVAIGMPADPIDIGSFALSAFMTKNLLANASVARLEGLPMLVLDPAQRRFYCEVDLAELAPYAQAPISRSAWSPIHPKDLACRRGRSATCCGLRPSSSRVGGWRRASTRAARSASRSACTSTRSSTRTARLRP
jgi:hypothetical protein